MDDHFPFIRGPRLPIAPYRSPVNIVNKIPGCVDWATRESEGIFLVRGWMMSPTVDLNAIQVYVNGTHVGAASTMHRQDLAANISWVPHAGRAGFEFRLNTVELSANSIDHLDLIGYRDPKTLENWIGAIRGRNSFGIPVGRYHTLCRLDLDSAVPSPPPQLMDRVVGHHDLTAFKTGGIKLYGDFLEVLSRHCNLGSITRMLDWGCGCGRSTVHFLLHHPRGPEVHGCDIDGEAIAWCNQNLKPGKFVQVDASPPTPYPDSFFDIIVSCSVLSHLKRDVQHLWLAELNRIVKPGGIVLPSFHGPFSASVSYPPRGNAAIRRDGIVDDTPDTNLGDIVEPGYYNATFQTREYTMQEWSKHFEFAEYVDAGMHNYQDLVVLKKR